MNKEISEQDIRQMNRQELVDYVTEQLESGPLEKTKLLNIAFDRIDEIDGVEKDKLSMELDYMNSDAFDNLPVEKQLIELKNICEMFIGKANQMRNDSK